MALFTNSQKSSKHKFQYKFKFYCIIFIYIKIIFIQYFQQQFLTFNE